MRLQRAASSTSSADAVSPFRLTMAGCAATAVAAGSIAWYYHLYGQEVFAMTPVEEG
jgi:ubiquinol-cytochrome c reductase cytochrome c1 subunit